MTNTDKERTDFEAWYDGKWFATPIDIREISLKAYRAGREAERAETVTGRKFYGPHGYLIITKGLNEEYWRLEFSPECDSDEISIALSAEVDPFAVTRAALTKPEGK
jgi:hypothetical protein